MFSWLYCKDNPIKNIDSTGEQEVPAEYQLSTVTVSAERKRSFWEKAGAFGKGLLVGVVIAVAVVAVVATGGALLAAAAPALAATLAASSTVAAIGTGLSIAGGAATAWNTVQSLRGRDFMNNKISSMEASYNLGFGLGGVLAGPASKPISKFISKVIPAKPVTFGVDPALQSADEAAGEVFKNGKYLENPTAVNAEGLHTNPSGTVALEQGTKPLNGSYMYTVDDAGSQLTIGTRAKGDLIFDGKAPHPTLIGGTPRVQAAGMIEFRGGKIFSIDNLSGHC